MSYQEKQEVMQHPSEARARGGNIEWHMAPEVLNEMLVSRLEDLYASPS
jgi:hypothetical protein